MSDRPKVAAIIAAYNEAKTIEGVIRPLAASRLFDEIIVISDGSTDDTAACARRAGATLVHQLPIKSGKGAAVMHGVTHTDALILFFCDADLYGLTVQHLDSLLRPVREGHKVMNVGLRDRGNLMMKLAAHLPLIGGERALKRHVIADVPPQFLRGFMLEAALNYHCRKEKLPYGAIPLPGLTIRRKMEKVGFWRGLREYIDMYYQVIEAMLMVRIAHWRGEW
ncbi:glycosyltransferase [Candidatus Uhrbacteria bacterium]|nr:glycosyltransferase [Candidatus Uhrbacteria bacterium]